MKTEPESCDWRCSARVALDCGNRFRGIQGRRHGEGCVESAEFMAGGETLRAETRREVCSPFYRPKVGKNTVDLPRRKAVLFADITPPVSHRGTRGRNQKGLGNLEIGHLTSGI